MDKAHEVVKVSFSGDTMRLLADGREYNIDLSKHSKKLAGASAAQKQHYVISPSGYGIHWPEIDEDLSIDGLIGVTHKSPFAKSTN
mgnify:CR=1 FL=1